LCRRKCKSEFKKVCREKCKNEFKKDEQVTKNCVEENAKMNLKKMSE